MCNTPSLPTEKGTHRFGECPVCFCSLRLFYDAGAVYLTLPDLFEGCSLEACLELKFEAFLCFKSVLSLHGGVGLAVFSESVSHHVLVLRWLLSFCMYIYHSEPDRYPVLSIHKVHKYQEDKGSTF